MKITFKVRFKSLILIGDIMFKSFKLLRLIVLSTFLIYGFDVLANPLNILIPLNIITIFYVSIFGVSGLISLIIIYIISF